jgi:pimeloyl-ACP methyl ester carboxylesterase
LTLETLLLGPPSRTRLVFLHEGLGCVALWRDFPARLSAATGLGAFIYSRAGYGKSPRTELPRKVTYMHEEAELLPAILRSHEISLADAILVGHSDGASIALLCAAAQPVRGLLLEAPHVFTEEVGLASIARAREAFLHGDLRARLARHHADVDAAFWGWNGPWLDPGFRRWNIESALPAVRAPVLVIQGADDEYGTLAQVRAIEGQAGGPVEALVLNQCGHSPHKDRADAVVERAAAFAGKVALLEGQAPE